MRVKVGILLSGRGSNMQALVRAAQEPDCPYEVVLVASDKPNAPGLAFDIGALRLEGRYVAVERTQTDTCRGSQFCATNRIAIAS